MRKENRPAVDQLEQETTVYRGKRGIEMAEPTEANGSTLDSGNNTPMVDVVNATTQVRPGGAPARVYLNEKVVPYLLEGMKTITKDQ